MWRADVFSQKLVLQGPLASPTERRWGLEPSPRACRASGNEDKNLRLADPQEYLKKSSLPKRSPAAALPFKLQMLLLPVTWPNPAKILFRFADKYSERERESERFNRDLSNVSIKPTCLYVPRRKGDMVDTAEILE